MHNLILIMSSYPEIQARAQAEIDSVVGRDRVPSFADRPHLPYIRALVRELLRWRPAGPLGESSIWIDRIITFYNILSPYSSDFHRKLYIHQWQNHINNFIKNRM